MKNNPRLIKSKDSITSKLSDPNSTQKMGTKIINMDSSVVPKFESKAKSKEVLLSKSQLVKFEK